MKQMKYRIVRRSICPLVILQAMLLNVGIAWCYTHFYCYIYINSQMSFQSIINAAYSRKMSRIFFLYISIPIHILSHRTVILYKVYVYCKRNVDTTVLACNYEA